MSKAKARARAKARTLAKLANRKPKGEKADEADTVEAADAKTQRPSHADVKGGQGRQFGPASHIKSAARTTRGSARSR